MNIKLKLIILGLSYFSTNIVYFKLYEDSVKSCNNKNFNFDTYLLLNQLSFFICYLFVSSYIISKGESFFLYICSFIFGFSTTIFSGIITFNVMIPYVCSFDIFPLIFLQSLLFFLGVLFLLFLLIYILFMICDTNNRKLHLFFYCSPILTWCIVTGYYVSIEESKDKCYTNYVKVTTIVEIFFSCLIILSKMIKLKKVNNYLIICVSFISLVNFIVGKKEFCFTPMKICSIIPSILCSLMCSIIIIFLILKYIFTCFFDSIMERDDYTNEELLLRLGVIIMEFPVFNIFNRNIRENGDNRMAQV